MPKKSKTGLIIGVLVVLLLALGGGWYYWQSRSKTTGGTAANPSSGTASTAVENCGAKVSDWTDQGTNYGKHIDPADTPYGLSLHSGSGTADDAITEFCEARKMREQAEAYIDTLTQKDWDKAYTFLSTGSKAVSLETKKANWTGEYGAYSFSLKTALAVGTEKEKTTFLDYSIEPCLEDKLSDGWTKNILKGYYISPLMTSSDNAVSTSISLNMVKQDKVWKVDGEANQLYNYDALTDKDAYAKVQRDREFRPNNCSGA